MEQIRANGGVSLPPLEEKLYMLMAEQEKLCRMLDDPAGLPHPDDRVYIEDEVGAYHDMILGLLEGNPELHTAMQNMQRAMELSASTPNDTAVGAPPMSIENT